MLILKWKTYLLCQRWIVIVEMCIRDRSHTIHFQSQSYQGAILGIDHLVVDLQEHDCISIKMASKTARFLQYKQVPFTKRLKRAYLRS